MASSPRVALVLAGGGARGAYEAGLLSVLLPELERRGELPSVIVGTSVGAVSAVHLASNLHRGAVEATQLIVEDWSQLTMGDVLRPVLWRQAPRSALLYAADALGVPGVGLRALLDAAPMQRTVERWIDWTALHRNIREGVVDAVGAVATSASSGRSVVFLESSRRRPPRPSYSMRWAPTRLDVGHVRASSAIPTVLPAVRVERPRDVRGFYFDGGTRLNTPIKPALDLGAERVAILATHALGYAEHEGEDREDEPNFADGAVELLQATLVDPLIEDARMLGKMNLLVESVSRDSPAAAEIKRRNWRRVEHLFLGPSTPGEVGRLALRVLSEDFSGLGRLRSPDVSFLGRLIGGRSEQQGELLSYLLFRPEFTRAAIELGRRDAERRLEEARAQGDLWSVGPPGT